MNVVGDAINGKGNGMASYEFSIDLHGLFSFDNLDVPDEMVE
jgi:hypothetical protein